MITNYKYFLNEAKLAELQVGQKIVFHGRYYIYGWGYLELDGRTGIIKDIRKVRYGTNVVVTMDEIIIPSWKKEITLQSTQLRNIEIMGADYQETLEKIKAGQLVKFKSSKEFLWTLKAIKFKIKGDYFNITDFDVVKDDSNSVSFIPAKKTKEESSEKFRQVSKVGRVLKKLNPDLSDKQIEDFVDAYKAECEAEVKIEVVTGDKISYWYHEKRYKKGGGSLNNSCMRYDHTQSQVRFYDSFPDRIALAIYVKDGLLHARALIWKLDDGRVYMDRIFSVSGAATVQLQKYASKNNMLMYKNRGNHTFSVTLETGKTLFPYFDTFYNHRRSGKNLILYHNSYR